MKKKFLGDWGGGGPRGPLLNTPMSYSRRIAFSLSTQTFLSSSDRLLRNRLSMALARRRAARQSASNHGVFCLVLRRTVTIGQWRSSRSVSTDLAKSSTDKSLSASRLLHSLDAAKSDAKSSRDSRRHALLFVYCNSSTRGFFTLSVKRIRAWSDIMSPVRTPEMAVSLLVMTRGHSYHFLSSGFDVSENIVVDIDKCLKTQ